MVNEFVTQWYKNSYKLREKLRKVKNHELEYIDLVNLLIKEVINPNQNNWDFVLDERLLIEIDHGDYQGTQIYIVPRKGYQPNEEDYFFTHNDYGSCSGCDTLLGIWSWSEDGYISDRQVDDLMTLCMHLLQRFKPLIQEFDVPERKIKDIL